MRSVLNGQNSTFDISCEKFYHGLRKIPTSVKLISVVRIESDLESEFEFEMVWISSWTVAKTDFLSNKMTWSWKIRVFYYSSQKKNLEEHLK